MNNSINHLNEAFKDKDYRHGYADEFLNASIATQIKVLREQRDWSQIELADHAKMMQPRISVMENVNYSSWSIKILRKLAEAFDLTLRVSFESFGTRMDDIEKFSRQNLEKSSFEDDSYFKEPTEDILLEAQEILKAPGQPEYKVYLVPNEGQGAKELDSKRDKLYGYRQKESNVPMEVSI